jgi:hypothetical protein
MSNETKYAIFQEIDDDENTTVLTFIKYNGNEENLNHLKSCIEKVKWINYDGYSRFTLDLDYLVSQNTAKEMKNIETYEHCSFRKFDGNLKKIDFNFQQTDRNIAKHRKVNKLLGGGRIEEYIDNEDLRDNEVEESSGEDSSEEESSECNTDNSE